MGRLTSGVPLTWSQEAEGQARSEDSPASAVSGVLGHLILPHQGRQAGPACKQPTKAVRFDFTIPMPP